MHFCRLISFLKISNSLFALFDKVLPVKIKTSRFYASPKSAWLYFQIYCVLNILLACALNLFIFIYIFLVLSAWSQSSMFVSVLSEPTIVQSCIE